MPPALPPAPVGRAPFSPVGLAAIVLGNLAPLAGVAFLGWSLGEVLLLFWLESALIGGFHLLRMLHAGRRAAVGLALFFVVHFGTFMLVHLFFLVLLFVPLGPFAEPGEEPLDLRNVGWASLALLASHAVSFHVDYLRDPRARARPFRDWMGAPYPRVVAMHLTILAGAFLALHLGSPRPALLVLVGVKTLLDVGLHALERRRADAAPAA